MMPTHARRLVEGYFGLRQHSDGLKKASYRFEGAQWHQNGRTMARCSDDGGKLLVYEIEGGIEACIIEPNGTSKTFS